MEKVLCFCRFSYQHMAVSSNVSVPQFGATKFLPLQTQIWAEFKRDKETNDSCNLNFLTQYFILCSNYPEVVLYFTGVAIHRRDVDSANVKVERRTREGR